VEAIEATGVGHKLRAFRLERLPDRLLRQFRVAMGFGASDAFIEQPGVHLVIGLEAQPRRELEVAARESRVGTSSQVFACR
jgi:hypothetical protein